MMGFFGWDYNSFVLGVPFVICIRYSVGWIASLPLWQFPVTYGLIVKGQYNEQYTLIVVQVVFAIFQKILPPRPVPPPLATALADPAVGWPSRGPPSSAP